MATIVGGDNSRAGGVTSPTMDGETIKEVIGAIHPTTVDGATNLSKGGGDNSKVGGATTHNKEAGGAIKEVGEATRAVDGAILLLLLKTVGAPTTASGDQEDNHKVIVLGVPLPMADGVEEAITQGILVVGDSLFLFTYVIKKLFEKIMIIHFLTIHWTYFSQWIQINELISVFIVLRSSVILLFNNIKYFFNFLF